MGFSAVTYLLALDDAKAYTNSVALHGVPINQPQIDGATKHWKIFDPLTNSYYDTGYVAEGKNAPIPEIGVNGNWYIGGQDTGRPAVARDVELARQGDYIAWRYVGASTWNNMVPLSELKADDGLTAEFHMQGNVLQIRYHSTDPFEDFFTFPDAGQTGGDDGIDEAPKDNKYYVRKNGAWVVMPDTGEGGTVGGYEPPAGGIPKGDLSTAVQESLNKADTALQEEEDPVYTADKPTIAKKTEVAAAVSAHNTDTDAHTDIRDAIGDLIGIVEWDHDTYTLTFTARNGETLKVDLPLEALAKDIDYDPATQEIVITKQDDTEIRISVASLVDEYTGLTNAHIQITIENHEIEATLLDGSIGEAKLSPALLAKINGKADKSEIDQQIDNKIHDKANKIQNLSWISIVTLTGGDVYPFVRMKIEPTGFSMSNIDSVLESSSDTTARIVFVSDYWGGQGHLVFYMGPDPASRKVTFAAVDDFIPERILYQNGEWKPFVLDMRDVRVISHDSIVVSFFAGRPVFYTGAILDLWDVRQEISSEQGQIEALQNAVNALDQDKLGKTETAVNSEKLGNKPASEFATAEQGEKADNSAQKDSQGKISVSELPITGGNGINFGSNGRIDWTGQIPQITYWLTTKQIGIGLVGDSCSIDGVATFTRLSGAGEAPGESDIAYTSDGFSFIINQVDIEGDYINGVITQVPPPSAYWNNIQGSMNNNKPVPALLSDGSGAISLIWLDAADKVQVGSPTVPTNINSNGRLTNNNNDIAYQSDVTAISSALSGLITSETGARAVADAGLQANIDGEATARQQADTILQGNIDDEAAARADADTLLQENIDGIIDDSNVGYATTYSSRKIEDAIVLVYHTVPDVATATDLPDETEIQTPSICYVADEKTQYINSKTGSGWRATGGNFTTIDDVMQYLADNNYLKGSNVINNLTSNVVDKPLSAAMGKQLQDTKLSATQVVDNVSTADSTNPLSANMGKYLNDNMLKPSNIINNTSSTSTTDALAADQGRVLNDKVTAIEDKFNGEKAKNALLADTAAAATKLVTPFRLTITDTGYSSGTGFADIDGSGNVTINRQITGPAAVSMGAMNVQGRAIILGSTDYSIIKLAQWKTQDRTGGGKVRIFVDSWTASEYEATLPVPAHRNSNSSMLATAKINQKWTPSYTNWVVPYPDFIIVYKATAVDAQDSWAGDDATFELWMVSHSHYFLGYSDIAISDYNSSQHQFRIGTEVGYTDIADFITYCMNKGYNYFGRWASDKATLMAAASDSRITLTGTRGAISALVA
jgi:hypothetical protein